MYRPGETLAKKCGIGVWWAGGGLTGSLCRFNHCMFFLANVVGMMSSSQVLLVAGPNFLHSVVPGRRRRVDKKSHALCLLFGLYLPTFPV